MTISIELHEDLEARLEKLSARTGLPKNLHVVQAIENHLDELEDVELAETRLEGVRAGRSQTSTLAEVEQELGLADRV